MIFSDKVSVVMQLLHKLKRMLGMAENDADGDGGGRAGDADEA